MVMSKSGTNFEGIKVQNNLDGFSVMAGTTPYQEMPPFYDMPVLRILSRFKQLSFKIYTPPPHTHTPPAAARRPYSVV
jgi:hypothetical protein